MMPSLDPINGSTSMLAPMFNSSTSMLVDITSMINVDSVGACTSMLAPMFNSSTSMLVDVDAFADHVNALQLNVDAYALMFNSSTSMLSVAKALAKWVANGSDKLLKCAG